MFTRKMMKVGLVVLILGVASTAVGVENSAQTESEKRKHMIKVIKKNLDNTSWQIELTETATGKKKAKKTEEDVLHFVNGQIGSEKMVSEGFPPTNFTVRVKHEDVIIWETMQRSEEEGIGFWRGQIREGKMRGVLSWHLDEKKIKDYRFASEAKDIDLFSEEAKVEEVKEEIEAAVEIAVPEVLEEVEETKEAPEEAPMDVIEETVIEEKPAAKVEVKEEEPKPEKKEEKKEEKKKKGRFWRR
ncbi:hypothetical protein ACFL28_01790 [Candidatus Omnitrophota bacterium]